MALRQLGTSLESAWPRPEVGRLTVAVAAKLEALAAEITELDIAKEPLILWPPLAQYKLRPYESFVS